MTVDDEVSAQFPALESTYATALEGFGASWRPVAVPETRVVRLNEALAKRLGLDVGELRTDDAIAVLAGSATPEGATPISQVYAGHQFGNFNPQLGDGRAVVLGEIVDSHGDRFDLALKGSGRTPFSRGGDGKAGLTPVLREYLMGEAMHALGVPTTRALAAVTTGEMIRRERVEPGAVLTRVASSHLRVGTFQFFAARGDVDRLRQLLEYTIDRHGPDLARHDDPPLALLDAVIARQAKLIATWMNLGFIHGVMNTDNVTISGETIDYGPCAFLDAYDPTTVFSSIDHGGRYAYGNQPTIGLWNMARLAEALLPLIHDDQERAVELATASLDRYQGLYDQARLDGLRRKLGLDGERPGDQQLVDEWFDLLHANSVDMTTAFRRLSAAADGTLESRVGLTGLFEASITDWLDRWTVRLADDAPAQMQAVNPVYVPRNHLVEEALDAAVAGDLAPFDRLLEVTTHPFDERPGLERFAQPAPAGFTDGYRTFCGT